jgi:hypothetical protein
VPELLSHPLFLSLSAGVLIILGTTFARSWVKVRRATLEAELKMEMIQRGMSADEIERVLGARLGSSKSSLHDLLGALPPMRVSEMFGKKCKKS